MSDKPTLEHTVANRRQAEFADEVIVVLNAAMRSGMTPEEVCCVAVSVVADLCRINLGDEALALLAKIVADRHGYPLPEVHFDQPLN